MSGRKLLDRLCAEARKHPWCQEVHRSVRRTALLDTRTPAKPTASRSGAFALEAPSRDSLQRIEPILDWYTPDKNEAATYILQVTVDGKPTARLSRGYRSDVAAAYPTNPRAVRSGFFGVVVLTSPDSAKREVTVGIDRVDAECRTNLLGSVGREVLAAGVYVRAHRPRV